MIWAVGVKRNKFIFILSSICVFGGIYLLAVGIYYNKVYAQYLDNNNNFEKNLYNYNEYSNNLGSNNSYNYETVENTDVDSTITSEGILKTVNINYDEIIDYLNSLKRQKIKVSRVEITFSDSKNVLLSYLQRDVSDSQIDLVIKRVEKILSLPVMWISKNSDIENHAILTGFVVDGNKREFELKGVTLKHKYIFNELFPILESVKGIHTPFFREGKFSDYINNKRIMRFIITVQWQE